MSPLRNLAFLLIFLVAAPSHAAGPAAVAGDPVRVAQDALKSCKDAGCFEERLAASSDAVLGIVRDSCSFELSNELKLGCYQRMLGSLASEPTKSTQGFRPGFDDAFGAAARACKSSGNAVCVGDVENAFLSTAVRGLISSSCFASYTQRYGSEGCEADSLGHFAAHRPLTDALSDSDVLSYIDDVCMSRSVSSEVRGRCATAAIESGSGPLSRSIRAACEVFSWENRSRRCDSFGCNDDESFVRNRCVEDATRFVLKYGGGDLAVAANFCLSLTSAEACLKGVAEAASDSRITRVLTRCDEDQSAAPDCVESGIATLYVNQTLPWGEPAQNAPRCRH